MMIDKENRPWRAPVSSVTNSRAQEASKKSLDHGSYSIKRAGDRAGGVVGRGLGLSIRGRNTPSSRVPGLASAKQDSSSTPSQGPPRAQRVLLDNTSDIYLSLWDHPAKDGGPTPLLAGALSGDPASSTSSTPRSETGVNGFGSGGEAAGLKSTKGASKIIPKSHEPSSSGKNQIPTSTRSPRATTSQVTVTKPNRVTAQTLTSKASHKTSGGTSTAAPHVLARRPYAHILDWEPAPRTVSSRKEVIIKDSCGAVGDAVAGQGKAGSSTKARNGAKSHHRRPHEIQPAVSAAEQSGSNSIKNASRGPTHTRISSSQGATTAASHASAASDTRANVKSGTGGDVSGGALDTSEAKSPGGFKETVQRVAGKRDNNVPSRASKATVRKPAVAYGGALAELGALRVKIHSASGSCKGSQTERDSDEEDEDSTIEVQTSSGATIRRSSADSPLKPIAVATKAANEASPLAALNGQPSSDLGRGSSPAASAIGRARTNSRSSASGERFAERSAPVRHASESMQGSMPSAGPRVERGSVSGTTGRNSAGDDAADVGSADADYDSSGDDMSITHAVGRPRSSAPAAPAPVHRDGRLDVNATQPMRKPTTKTSASALASASSNDASKDKDVREARASRARPEAKQGVLVVGAGGRSEARIERGSGRLRGRDRESPGSSRSNHTGSSSRSTAGLGASAAGADIPLSPEQMDSSNNSGTSGVNVSGSGLSSSDRNVVTSSGGSGPGSSGSSQISAPCSCGEPSGVFGSFQPVVVQGRSYLKTVKIGRGGSSEVFRVLSSDGQMLALKTVKVDGRGDQAEALLSSYANEIELLRSFRGSPYIINLENAEVDRKRGVINIVLELGESDLSKVIKQAHRDDGGWTKASRANFMKHLWDQMLRGVHAMHEDRVVHGDLKPANFVFVQTRLKLIDFGIAKAISNDTTNISRDTQVGTLNYMSPEAFKDTGKGGIDPVTGRAKPMMKLGRASDIWSLGCMLYQMTYGHPPFSHLGMVQKVHAITNPNYAISFGPLDDGALLDTLRGCLERDPQKRPPIAGPGGLLTHRYLDAMSKDNNGLETTVEMKLSTIRKMESAIASKVAEIKRKERDIAATVEARVAAEVKSRLAAAPAASATGGSGRR